MTCIVNNSSNDVGPMALAQATVHFVGPAYRWVSTERVEPKSYLLKKLIRVVCGVRGVQTNSEKNDDEKTKQRGSQGFEIFIRPSNN